jgi:phosphoglycolate phosphatase
LLNRTKEIGAFVFDLDGTLIDSAPGILAAFAASLHETGIEPQVTLAHKLIGPPLTETLMRISGSTDAALVQRLADNFKRHYDTAGVAATLAYPGIDAMLDQLVEAGIPMHIGTNKRLSVTHAILENLGWKNRFVSVYALDMTEPRLPGKTQLLTKQIEEQRLAPSQTLYVGDKREDGHAADANKLAFYYASWGYGELEREKLDARWNWLDQPSDLVHSSL